MTTNNSRGGKYIMIMHGRQFIIIYHAMYSYYSCNYGRGQSVAADLLMMLYIRPPICSGRDDGERR